MQIMFDITVRLFFNIFFASEVYKLPQTGFARTDTKTWSRFWVQHMDRIGLLTCIVSGRQLTAVIETYNTHIEIKA